MNKSGAKCVQVVRGKARALNHQNGPKIMSQEHGLDARLPFCYAGPCAFQAQHGPPWSPLVRTKAHAPDM
eukprot:950115-Amphidinium_carterae.1